MRRRGFLTLVAGSATAAFCTRTASAQPERKRLIGFLGGISEAEWRPQIDAFIAELGKLGWPEGIKVAVELRASAGDFRRLKPDAAALVSAGADVIVALGTPGLKAAQQQTRTVPIVFVSVSDPVGQGLIVSLARPGGNATGLTNFEFSMGSKWIELLKDLDHNIARTTLIINPANTNNQQFQTAISSAASALAIEVSAAPVTGADDIKRAIASAGQKRNSSIIVFPDSLPFVHRALIIGLAAQHRVPAMYPFREFSRSGGLIAYGLDQMDVYRLAAAYVDKILRGAKPSELPVQAPNKFEMAINLKAAKALGLTVPPTLLARADEVIE